MRARGRRGPIPGELLGLALRRQPPAGAAAGLARCSASTSPSTRGWCDAAGLLLGELVGRHPRRTAAAPPARRPAARGGPRPAGRPRRRCTRRRCARWRRSRRCRRARVRRDGHGARPLRRRGARRSDVPALHPASGGPVSPGGRVRRGALARAPTTCCCRRSRAAGRPRPLVLVDDELTTGRTALNTIAALHAAAPRDRYVLATLVDLREDDARRAARRGAGGRRGVDPRGPDPADRPQRARTACAPSWAAPRRRRARRPPGQRRGRTATASTASTRSARPACAANPTAPPQGRVPGPTAAGPPGCPRAAGTASTAADHRSLAAALPGSPQRSLGPPTSGRASARSCSAPRS